MFVGSAEFGTTLWGLLPYLTVGLLGAKVLGFAGGMDAADWTLFGFWSSFALLLEFFPNGFQLDAYYSVPRIFRYLAPLSFPMALATAKALLDLLSPRRRAVTVAVLVSLLTVFVVQGRQANGPSLVYRRSLFAVLDELRRLDPPQLVTEFMIGIHLRDLYLDPNEQQISVWPVDDIYHAPEHETWLRAHEHELRDGAFLLTGLSSYVHYGAHVDGFRLAWFEKPLSPAWTLVGAYGSQSYLPRPEPARLWKLTKPKADVVHDLREDVAALGDLLHDGEAVFREGMRHYDALEYAAARPYFRALRDAPPPRGNDAAFFYAASFFRQDAWERAEHEFKRLLHHNRRNTLYGQALWHIATCESRLGRTRRGRRLFERIVREIHDDPVAVNAARGDLRALERRHRGVLQSWWHSRS